MYHGYPMMGEVATGLLGRIAVLNGHRTQAEAAAALRAHCERYLRTHPKATLVTHLAAISDLALEDFVQRHTMMPYLRAVSRRGPGCPHGSAADLNIVRRLGMILGRRDTQLCAQCALEAKKELGYSFYSREHQIVGIEWCEKHDRPLLRLPVAMELATLPHWHLSGASIASTEAERHQAHPVVRRYLRIARGFLERRAAVPTAFAVERIRRRAEGMGLITLPTAVGRSRATLGAFARGTAPRRWLRSLAGTESSIESVVRALDLRLMSGVTTPIYALAAALVYPSAEAALDDLRQPATSARRPSAARRR